MTRKRKRSAYTALSSARVHRYQQHQNSRPHSSAAHQITHTPPEAITEFESSQPSPHTPISTSNQPNSNHNTTPLVLRASDISSVQAALGFTPDTPANSIIYLGTDEQQRAEDLINSPNCSLSQTPRTARRLSLGSTVTPIPLNLESPQPQQPLPPQPLPSVRPNHPPPSPVTPHQHIDIPSPPPSPNTQTPDLLHSDSLIDSAPLALVDKPVKPLDNPISPPLFTTASGKPLAPLSKSLPAPLFTTGKGKPILPLASKSFSKADSLLDSGTSTAPHAPNPLVRSLFSTGKGKPLDIYKSLIPTSIRNATNQTPLFTTAAGKRITPSTNCRPAPLLHRPTSIPRLPQEQSGNVRKVLFADTSPATNKPALHSHVHTPLQRKVQPRSVLKTTPFRRPRRVVPPKTVSNVAITATHHPSIPRWNFPKLSTKGQILCDSLRHSETHLMKSNTKRESRKHQSFGFLSHPNCLQTCLRFVFEKEEFGRYNCLPTDVVQYFQFEDLASFSVGNLLSWTRSLFPKATESPASCFGSAAWTRMSYSLVIWKLARLENQKPINERTTSGSFLSAANVLREILRRIEYEWHSNRQPHLLRIMRKDSSPASHLVLVMSGFELTTDNRIFGLLSDGWYIARATFDEILEKRIWNGKLRVGHKISTVGAVLQDKNGSRSFFFGDGDELGSSVVRLSANGVRKAPDNISRLGRHPYPWSGSLRWVKDDGGKSPKLKVVILRSYPTFYLESISATDNEDRGFIFRRAEGEDRAREIHEEQARRELQTDANHGERKKENCTVQESTCKRDVRSVKEILVCGVHDDPRDSSARKLVRIYKVSEALQVLIGKEGSVLFLSEVNPKKNGWTCKPDAVQPGPRNRQTSFHDAGVAATFPRKICSVPELRSKAVDDGHDFDGVFLVLYVTSDRSNRFAYLTSAPTDAINVLALQLSDADAECLPAALQFKRENLPAFPRIGIRDARYCYRDNNLDILHANSTMRTSFLTSRSLSRIDSSDPLRVAYDDLETHIKGREPQLEVLRDAIISFASGNRSSVSAYFTSTQDMC